MKKLCILSLLIALVFSGCGSKASKKSIFEKLSQKELAEETKNRKGFAGYYKIMRLTFDYAEMSDVQKATYKGITWRRAFKYWELFVKESGSGKSSSEVDELLKKEDELCFNFYEDYFELTRSILGTD